MKNSITLLFAFLTLGSMYAQTPSSTTTKTSNVDCQRELSMFYQSAKIKDYKSAKPHYEKLIENCPSMHLAIYQYGSRMLEYFMANTQDEQEKTAYAKALINNYENRLEYFPEKTEEAPFYTKIAMAKFENKLGTTQELYDAFDKAWNADKEAFANPKALYVYFSLLVDLHDAGKASLNDVFKKYDAVMTKISLEEAEHAKSQAELRKKKESGQPLTAKEKRQLSNDAVYLSNYTKVKKSIDVKIGKRADCENLIPLYSKQFADHSTDKEWLQIAAHRLSAKKCTDGEMFFKIVEALNKISPSAKSAKYLGQLAMVKGQTSKAIEYFKQSIELESNKLDKANVYFRIANVYKDQGRFAAARNYYRKAIANNPSFGIAYLRIASMYASSVNQCGDDIFTKRSVYWLAADMAERAARVDPSLRSVAQQTAKSYRGRAPSKADIFKSGKAGETITINCWFQETVTVPTL